MNIVSIHQPAYLPWLGYFHKIALSDIFVFFNTTQFEKNSYINRNKIKTAQGEQWLTVPVQLKNHLQKEIRQIEIADLNWQKKHWKSIELNYRKSAFWHNYAHLLQNLYFKDYKTIDEVCYEQLILFKDLLGLKTKIVRSSDLPEFKLVKQDLILGICQEFEATVYLSGVQGKGYINQNEFTAKNIHLFFQDYKHPEYSQLWGSYIPYMSIIDLLFNHGPQSIKILMSNNISKINLLKQL